MRKKTFFENSNAKNITGKRIKEVRKQCQITQAGLATKLQLEGLECNSSTISKIELGRRAVTDYEIVGIAKCLKISVLCLLIEKPNT